MERSASSSRVQVIVFALLTMFGLGVARSVAHAGSGTELPESTEAAFTETIYLGSSELWVMGEPIPGPEVKCSFDESVLTVGGVRVPVSLSQMPQHTIPDSELTRRYGAVPAVQAQLAAGASIRQAVAVYEADRKALWGQASNVYRADGAAAAESVLISSPLIERVESTTNGSIRMFMKGFSYSITLDTRDRGPEPTITAKARARVDRIEEVVKARTMQRVLVMVTHDGTARFTGKSQEEAKAQIEHVRQTGDLSALPAGPLRAKDSFLQDVARAAKAKGQQR